MGKNQYNDYEVKNRFLGTWKLVSYEFLGPGGEASYPFGREVQGILHYDSNRNMAAQLMREGRGSFASGDQFGGTAEEIKEAFEGHFAYFGRYEINQSEGTVTHHIEGSSLPNWVGIDQVRSYEFSENRLILRTTPGRIDDSERSGKFVWEKISD